VNETSDLTPKERQALKSAVEIERGRKACEAEEIAEVKAMSKRKIFDDMMEGAAAMKSHREDEITLRAYNVEATPLPKVDSKLIPGTRNRLHCSRTVFARKLGTNERTLEKREHGRAKPSPQGAAIVLLVRKYPDTLERLERRLAFVPSEAHQRDKRIPSSRQFNR